MTTTANGKHEFCATSMTQLHSLDRFLVRNQCYTYIEYILLCCWVLYLHTFTSRFHTKQYKRCCWCFTQTIFVFYRYNFVTFIHVSSKLGFIFTSMGLWSTNKENIVVVVKTENINYFYLQPNNCICHLNHKIYTYLFWYYIISISLEQQIRRGIN